MSIQFELLVSKLLNKVGLTIESPSIRNFAAGDIMVPDFLGLIDDKVIVIEVKFYRSTHIAKSPVDAIYNQLIRYLGRGEIFKNPTYGLMVCSSYIPDAIKAEVRSKGLVKIWDRTTLYYILKEKFPDAALLEELQMLLFEAQQGTDTDDVFGEANSHGFDDSDLTFKNLSYSELPPVKTDSEKGKSLCKELRAVAIGREGWSDFEVISEKALRYLFNDSLTLWERQVSTDDELGRFDLICRILPINDFWKAIIDSFQSRFILIEFKNYKDQITQAQVYTTERYLYTKALRSTCLLIARNGATENAIKAAKGALREHGKLILILSLEDICNMLELKDKGDAPNDYLAEKLDKFLISIGR